jgi:hypothetical protein
MIDWYVSHADDHFDVDDGEGNISEMTATALEIFVLGAQAADLSVYDETAKRWLSMSGEMRAASRASTITELKR